MRKTQSTTIMLGLLAAACGSPPAPAHVRDPEPTVESEVPPEAEIERVEIAALDPTALTPSDVLPMIGADGRDALGEPLQSADPIGFQSLLRARRFDELCRHITTLQDRFEADVTLERWPIDALDAFNAVFPSSWDLHDAWVEASPDCFAAYAARGNFLTALALTARGRNSVDRTPQSFLDLMSRMLERAERDLRRAIELRPHLVAASMTLQSVLSAVGRADEVGATYEAALATCPDCLELRFAYLRNSRPRWGGDASQVRRVIDLVDATRRAGLGVLSGYLDYDNCYELRGARRYDEALAACDAAVAATPYWRYLFERGRVRRAMDDPTGALVDLDAALAARPRAAGPMLERVGALVALHREREAAEQLALLAHLIPDDDRAARHGHRLAPEVIRLRDLASTEGRSDEARRLDGVLHDILLPSDARRPTLP